MDYRQFHDGAESARRYLALQRQWGVSSIAPTTMTGPVIVVTPSRTFLDTVFSDRPGDAGGNVQEAPNHAPTAEHPSPGRGRHRGAAAPLIGWRWPWRG